MPDYLDSEGVLTKSLALTRVPGFTLEERIDLMGLESYIELSLLHFFAFMAPTGLPKSYLFRSLHLLPPVLAAQNAAGLSGVLAKLAEEGFIILSSQEICLLADVQKCVLARLDETLRLAWIESASRFFLAVFPSKVEGYVTLSELNRLAWHAAVVSDHVLAQGMTEIAENMMDLLDRLGRILIGVWPDRATICHQRSLHLAEGIWGHDHPATAIRLNNLGETWRRLQEFDKAEIFLKEALRRLKKKVGRNHPYVANILGSLGRLCVDQGQADAAENYFITALRLSENSRGLDDPLIFLCVNGLAKIARHRNDLQGVVALLTRAMAMNLRAGGPADHPNVAVILNNTAITLRDLGRRDEAKKKMQQALILFQKRLPSSHLSIRQIKKNLDDLVAKV